MFATQVFNLQYASLQWLTTNVDADFLSFSYPLDVDEMGDSIRECGVIQPLVVRGPETGRRALLICGHRRLQALKTLNFTQSIPMLMIPARELTLPGALQLAIADNVSSRTLNIIEKARVMYFALRRLALHKDEVLNQWLPRLGLKPSLHQLTSHLKVLQLPDPCLQYITRENLLLKTAEHLSEFEGDAMDMLFPLITRFQIGGNRLEEILSHVEIIAKRHNKSLVETLEDLLVLPEVAALLAAKDGDAPQKLEALRHTIRRTAYPTLAGMEEKFVTESKILNLPSEVQIKAPAFFEGDRLDVQFKIKSSEDLKRIAQKLLESADEPALNQLLDLL